MPYMFHFIDNSLNHLSKKPEYTTLYSLTDKGFYSLDGCF